MTKKLIEAVHQQKKQSQKYNQPIYGSLGIPINGAKTVEVPNRKSYVYVKLRDNQSEVIQAYNNKVSPNYNLPVIVERVGGRYAVVSVDTQRYENNWQSYTPFLPRHGNTHSFDPESGGGGDTVFVHTRQFLPLLTFPSGSAGAGNVFIAPYTLKNADGTWKYVGNTGTPNITPYNPTSSTGAIMTLVYLDSVSGNPYLLVGSGTVFSSAITGASQITPYIPALPNPSTQIPLSAIRLITGTAILSWDNIYDTRQFLHTVPTGTSGGGGNIDTGTLDARYVKLSLPNAPITGGKIQITPTGTSDGLGVQTKNNGIPFDFVQQGYLGATITAPVFSILRSPADDSNTMFTGTMFDLQQSKGSGTIPGGLLNFSSDSVSRVNINPSAQGTGTIVFFDGDFSLSNDGNLLLLKNHGSPKTKIAAQGNIEFGLGIVKQTGAGSIGYGLVDSGKLNIIGGGTSVPNREVKLYDNLTVDNQLQSQFMNLTNAGATYNINGSAHTHNYVSKSALEGHMFFPFASYVCLGGNISTSPSYPYSASIDRTVTLVKWAQSIYVATTNSGSHYWIIKLQRACDGFTLCTINTSAVSADACHLLTSTTFNASVVNQSDFALRIECTKSGSPGIMDLLGPMLEVSI